MKAVPDCSADVAELQYTGKTQYPEEMMIDPKRMGRYERIYTQLHELISGKSPTLTAAMSTIAAVLHFKLPHHFWTGFYFVTGPDQLFAGPYQGPVACQVLKGRGLCLKAAVSAQPVIVEDVTVLEDHIACDARSKSEIVIPVRYQNRVAAVLDIDSDKAAQFDGDDIAPLQRITGLLGPFLKKDDGHLFTGI